MIAFQSLLAGVAGPSFVNRRSAIGKSSPGGKDTDEGELKTNKPFALTAPLRLSVKKVFFAKRTHLGASHPVWTSQVQLFWRKNLIFY
jgi:hypothetical protein